jgi:hypothetical protein
MTRISFLTAAAFLAVSGWTWAGDAPPAPQPPQNDPKLREAFRKQRAGEALTPDEQQVLDQARQRMGNRGGNRQVAPDGAPGAPGPGARRGGPAGEPFSKMRTGLLRYGTPGELNVRQMAQVQLADLDLKNDKADDAIAKLEALLQAASTVDAKSVAAFNLGVIQLKKKNDAAKAKEYFQQVSGELAVEARQQVIGPLLAQGNSADAVRELNAFLLKASDAPTKAAIIHQLAQLLAETGDAGVLADFLAKVPTLITEEEAAAAAKEEARRFKENPAQRNIRMLPGGPVPPMGKPEVPAPAVDKKADAGPPPPPDAAGQPDAPAKPKGVSGKEMKGIMSAPDKDTALKQAREILQKAEQEGDQEVIQRLRRVIQHIEESQVWPPANPKGGGPGGKRNKGGGAPGAPGAADEVF